MRLTFNDILDGKEYEPRVGFSYLVSPSPEVWVSMVHPTVELQQKLDELIADLRDDPEADYKIARQVTRVTEGASEWPAMGTCSSEMLAVIVTDFFTLLRLIGKRLVDYSARLEAIQKTLVETSSSSSGQDAGSTAAPSTKS